MLEHEKSFITLGPGLCGKSLNHYVMQVTDEGSLPKIVQYGPSPCFECVTASKGSNNYSYSFL